MLDFNFLKKGISKKIKEEKEERWLNGEQQRLLK